MSIAAAVSGGMDSLLALALLRDRKPDVLALHAHFLPPDDAQLALAEALARQCAALGVAFEAVDLSGEFRSRVIEPFVAAYVEGRTPNPCAGCNRDMKFGLLAEHAARLGAKRIATGHYARLGEHGELLRGADPVKDQSYFLSLVPAASLARAVFPLGGWRKAEVPAELARRGLAPPLPRESQEVCFIPGDDYRAFLEAQGARLPGPGPILLEDGRRVGQHQGLWRHTIGQRKGLGVAWSEPLYVLEKRARDNALIAGPKAALDVLECSTEAANVLVPTRDWPRETLAQTCYRQRPRPVSAELREGRLRLRFHAPIPRPAPGQTAALYDASGRVLAAGVID
ncbi:tRNA methyl transferase PRC-barrel domain-containing protein [Fundidesulfovibrio agrisoli]|uniref:tRNA methyl transferase PRC-barrel domain-containing protein n=1 Tax=Fundidesulfovibrio agrisoli TaxID=2922717 RepID=UPI001FAD8A62|nr:tRNA methyl transferase PRC-barrel domain-containing protein [Fundidesulfovibrio agrisoli]